MKFKYLQKRLIRIGLICSSVILLSGVIAFFAIKHSAAKLEEIDKIKNEALSADMQYQSAERQHAEAIEAMKFYDNYNTSDNVDPENFRREFARNLLAKIKEQMELPDLKFTMGQFERAGKEYERETVALFTSKMVIEYSAHSDVEGYNLIKNIIISFPGQIKIAKYEISKAGEISEELLDRVASGAESTVIKGGIEFEWQSIRDNPDYKEPVSPDQQDDSAGNSAQNSADPSILDPAEDLSGVQP